MPIDLGVSQSIIGAYSQGRQEALQRQKLKLDTEQQAIENKQKADAAAEQTRQFNERLKSDQAQLEASHQLQQAQFNLSKALALPQFQKLAEESGNVAGFTPGPSQQGGDYRTFTGTAPGLEGTSFTAANPDVALKREVERKRALLGPEFEKLDQQQQFELNKLDQQEQLRLARESELADAQRAFEDSKLERQLANAREIAKINVAGRLEAAKVSGKAGRETTMLNTESNRFNNNKIVEQYANTQRLKKQVEGAGANAIGDYGLLVAYAKATDPESIVKDGERTAVEKAATTISQNLKVKIGRVNKLVPFLSPEGRTQIKAELGNLFDSSEENYNNFRSETIKRLKNQGIEDPEKYLVDFTLGEKKTEGAAGTGGYVIKKK